MKIIFVIPNLGSGGAERVISILSTSFADEDINVDIILMHNKEVAYPISKKVNIIYFDMDLLSCPKRLSCKIMRDYFKKQKQEYKKVVVIPFLDTCLKRTVISVAGLNIPVIACERNDPYQKGTGVMDRMKANLPYLMASYSVFQTTGALEYYYNRVQKKSTVIMNPLAMSENIKWNGIKSKRIVSVGRLEPQKNQLMLLKSFYSVHKEHPEYILEIYGEGSMREILQEKIYELQLEKCVFLRGHSSDIPKILEESFLFVLSSDYEGMSNALIEALAVGMPVVTTDHPCGGARMLVKDGENGILVPTGDAYAMANAINKLIESKNLAYKMGEKAYQIRERLSVKQIADQWTNVIKSI